MNLLANQLLLSFQRFLKFFIDDIQWLSLLRPMALCWGKMNYKLFGVLVLLLILSSLLLPVSRKCPLTHRNFCYGTEYSNHTEVVGEP